MVDYKLKLMHVENDTLNVFPIRKNDNHYHCGDYYVTFITDFGYLCGTDIPDKATFRINNIPTRIYSVIIYLHIGGTKYRFYSRNIYAATNITIEK